MYADINDKWMGISNLVKRLLIFSCLLVLLGCQPEVKPQGIQVQVKVARVVSGQTLEVIGMGDQPTLITQVRLVGIDAPDLQQRPWGTEAKERLEKMLEGKPVMLEFDVEAKDTIGRILAYAWQDGNLLNEKLIAQGYALFVPRSPNHKYDKRLERAQEWARLMGQGIWNPDKPMRLTPAQFRQQNR